ncbi:unnamed protein product [Kuraishia capsulata CBS 1993]|uniref:Uncharacterized protein n=1 Tax=Kuraishia capsulata CBS 1993 TaxID=1382522 RepID=W6MN88_9ASCO|nr:uncharacterized protein KUCA_T00004042001 [Kuraishia capsulata CBS 1993]CDK28061.1 unnamed protein product [Kuraishia capsulata CBS 1993]
MSYQLETGSGPNCTYVEYLQALHPGNSLV